MNSVRALLLLSLLAPPAAGAARSYEVEWVWNGDLAIESKNCTPETYSDATVELLKRAFSEADGDPAKAAKWKMDGELKGTLTLDQPGKLPGTVVWRLEANEAEGEIGGRSRLAEKSGGDTQFLEAVAGRIESEKSYGRVLLGLSGDLTGRIDFSKPRVEKTKSPFVGKLEFIVQTDPREGQKFCTVSVRLEETDFTVVARAADAEGSAPEVAAPEREAPEEAAPEGEERKPVPAAGRRERAAAPPPAEAPCEQCGGCDRSVVTGPSAPLWAGLAGLLGILRRRSRRRGLTP